MDRKRDYWRLPLHFLCSMQAPVVLPMSSAHPSEPEKLRDPPSGPEGISERTQTVASQQKGLIAPSLSPSVGHLKPVRKSTSKEGSRQWRDNFLLQQPPWPDKAFSHDEGAQDYGMSACFQVCLFSLLHLSFLHKTVSTFVSRRFMIIIPPHIPLHQKTVLNLN